MVRIRILVVAFLAMKDKEIQPKRVESSYKNTCQDSEISKATAL